MPNGILNNILVIFTKLPPSGPPKVGFQQNTCVFEPKIMKLGVATFFPITTTPKNLCEALLRCPC